MKKLTAGIFTALLGLVTVNAANAAIPSTTYVDTKITTAQTAAQKYADDQDAVLKQAIETDYEAADTALDGKITTNANAISAVDTFVAPDVAMTVGNANPTTVTAAINALDARITEKTSGIASEGTVNELTEAVEGLKTTVSGHTTDISGLETRMDTAEGSIATLTGSGEGSVAKAEADAIATANAYTDQLKNGQVKENTAAIAANAQAITNNATDTTNALALKANTADLGALAAKNTVATSDLDSTLQDAVGQVATNKSNIESLNTTVGTKAEQSALNATNAEVAKKVDKEGHAASQVVITDSTGAIATAAQIPNTQVSGLGDLATKSTIADADVAANAEIAQSKIAGLEAALANTTPKVTAKGEAGTYVLTAIVSDSGATSYQWEQIERPTTGGEG